jgi:inosine-uridine nucleoside N-ribohydrolase
MSSFLLALCLTAAPLQTADKPARIPVILDTDIGDDIDDAFALALVLASPELELRGVTTVFGDAYTRAQIVCRFLHAVDRANILVASGSPVSAKPTQTGQFQYGLRPGAARAPERASAVEFLYQQLKAHPGELTLLAVGPLTNIAELLRQHPDCKPWIKRLVIMGGSVRKGYDPKAQPEPEWNIKCDIKAAQFVFAERVPLVIAPLDSTSQLRLEADARRRLFEAKTPLTEELRVLYELWDKKTPVLFDPLAVALCFTEEHCTMEELALMVDDKGMTRITAGPPTARVAIASRREAFLTWYVERVRRPLPAAR